jgi:hypothetical protein
VVRAGCPRVLDYSKRRAPFWKLREEITFYLLNEDRAAEFMKVVALQRIGAQGFPGAGANLELADVLRLEATKAVKEYGRSAIPWLSWPTQVEEEQASKANMASEARELIDAWIQRFEPENGEALRAES